MEKTKQERDFEELVDAVGMRLAEKGVRVIALAALYDQVQRYANRHGTYGPSWAALCETLNRMEGYELCGYEDYTVTLPVLVEGPRRPDLLEAAYRVIDGIDAYQRKPIPGTKEHERLIPWILKQLDNATPEREDKP